MRGRPRAPITRLLGARVLSVNFLAPVTEGPAPGDGAVTRKARSTVFLEAALRNAAGAEYARASCVGSVRRPQK